MNEPLTAELVSIKLTREEYNTLIAEGQVVSDTDKESTETFEIPQGPAFINGQWI